MLLAYRKTKSKRNSHVEREALVFLEREANRILTNVDHKLFWDN